MKRRASPLSFARRVRAAAAALFVALFVALSASLGCAWTATGTLFTMQDVAELETAVSEMSRLRSQGRFREAVPFAERTVELVERFRGPDHPDVGACLNGLGQLYLETAQLDKAEAALTRSIAIREHVFGPWFVELGPALNNLGEVYRSRGDAVRAQPIFLRAIAVLEHARGPWDPQLTMPLNNLALLHFDRGEDAIAEPLFLRARDIAERAGGPFSSEMAPALNNLATLYLRQGRMLLAQETAGRALAISERALGPEHPNVAKMLANVAVMYTRGDDLLHAEPLLARALSIQEKALGPDHPALASTLGELAKVLSARGDHATALRLALRALSIQEKAHGPDTPESADYLSVAARAYRSTGEPARGEALLVRALAIVEKGFGPADPRVLETAASLAAALADRGDYGRAEEILTRISTLREKLLGPDHPGVAESLIEISRLHMRRGDLAAAEPFQKRALAILEKDAGSAHGSADGAVRLAESLGAQAKLLMTRGEYASAGPIFERARAVLEKAVGPSHPATAAVLDDLAMLHKARGDLAKAEALARQAVAIRAASLGREHPLHAASLNGLGLILHDKGDDAGALVLLEQALAIAEKAFGKDHVMVATTLANLCVINMRTGDLLRAEQQCKRAVEIREPLGADQADLGIALNNLGEVYRQRGTPTRALPYFERAIGILEKALGASHPGLASALNNLGLALASTGQLARARDLDLRALAIREKALGPDHVETAQSRNNLAEIYRVTGQPERARALYKSAIATMTKSVGPDHPDLAVAKSNLAAEHTAEKNIQGAVAEAFDAADIEDRNAARLLLSGAEAQKHRYMATLSHHYHQMISLSAQEAPADPAAARLALTIILRRKSRVLDVMVDSLAALRGSLDPSDRGLADRLAAVYSRLTTELSRAPGEVPVDEYRKSVARLEAEREALETQVGRRSAAFRAERPLVTVADVQAALPEGAALVEIARYVPFRARTATSLAPRYVAYVLRREGAPVCADLGEAAILEGAVERLRRALADHDRSHDPRPAARALELLVTAPVRPLLGDAHWVFMSPDGPLHLIPFGALVDEDDHYLVERYLFSYLTTGRDLLRLDGAGPAAREAPLVLASPAFDESSAPRAAEAERRDVRSVDMIARRLPPLESTKEEARTIAQLFPGTRVLLGADATEEAVKATHGPAVLHLATHGFFLPEQPVPEVLLRAGPGKEPTDSERTAVFERENPLLRSGVALAGFNRGRSGADDGVLTALEVSGLDLRGTRLVVLSTCESGLGEATTGEGVLGLRRALVIAGSETQVISLWQVDTGRTREMMQAFYRGIRDGRGRSQAMRDVQIAMLANASTAHPNLWASFVVSGDWRPMAPSWPAAAKVEPPRVEPGPRGCSCEHAGAGGAVPGYTLFLLLASALWFARRRSRSFS